MKIARWLWVAAISINLWIATDWITNWVLGHSYHSNRQLQTNVYPKTQITRALIITAIDATIDRNQNVADVTLATKNSTLARLEFKFLLTENTDLELAIAQALNTTSDAVQTLIRYRFE